MKKLALIGCISFGLIAACNGDPRTARPEHVLKCRAALVAVQNLKGKSVANAREVIAMSPTIQDVPIIYGQTEIAQGTAQLGTLVFEVNRPLGTPVEDMLNEPVRNIYCYA